MKKLFAAVLVLAAISFWACQKEFSYETNTDVASTGAWEFKDSSNTTYTGNPSEFYVDTTNSTALMQYTGVTANQRGVLSIGINFPTRRAATGTYTSALGQVDFTYSFGNGNTYRAESSSRFSTENITVIITLITDTSVTGTFSGLALDSLNRTRIVKEGKFTYKKRAASTTPTPTTSTGTLGTTTDTCTGAVLGGTYRKNVAITSANTVTITANVTATGTYTIYSDTLKGIYFRNTGTFSTTGSQSVVIPALGTPTDSGTVRFRIRYGTSSCTFQVKIDTVALIVVPATGDYYPLTANSNWSYDYYNQSGVFQDSLYKSATGTTVTILGSAFSILKDSDGDSTYIRKASGLYYQAEDISDFIGGTTSYAQSIILKDNVANGTTWADSANVTYNGFAGKLKLNYSITGKAVTATVNNFSFPDVIKVNVNWVFTPTLLPVPVTVLTIDSWYARGVGLVYEKAVDKTTTPNVTAEGRLRRFQIN